jgi:hypothetical protein
MQRLYGSHDGRHLSVASVKEGGTCGDFIADIKPVLFDGPCGRLRQFFYLLLLRWQAYEASKRVESAGTARSDEEYWAWHDAQMNKYSCASTPAQEKNAAGNQDTSGLALVKRIKTINKRLACDIRASVQHGGPCGDFVHDIKPKMLDEVEEALRARNPIQSVIASEFRATVTNETSSTTATAVVSSTSAAMKRSQGTVVLLATDVNIL